MTAPRHDTTRSQRATKAVATLLIVVTLAVIAAATLVPQPANPAMGHLCIVCGPRGGLDVALNVLLFFPLGLGLALRRVRARWAIPAMTLLSVTIEVLQYFLITGRNGGVSDVITNSLGGILGFSAGSHLASILWPSPRVALRWVTAWAVIWLAIQAVAAYSFVPVVPEPRYYLQIARPLGVERVQFSGRVLSAAVGDVPLNPRTVREGGVIRDLPSHPQPIRLTIIPGGRARSTAELITVSGTRFERVFGFDQRGTSFLFRFRTGADQLRLQSYQFRLPDILDWSADAARDSVTLVGRYAAREVVMAARTDRVVTERRFVPRLSEGWRVLTPFPTYIDGGPLEALASDLFVVLAILPLGYWLGFAFGTRRRLLGATAATVTVLLAAGFVGLPVSMGLPRSTMTEWLAAMLGVTAGIALARYLGRIRLP